MELDKLQIELRPRSNAQALDLGFTLLRANAASVYAAWLALWLPLMAVMGLLSYLFPAKTIVWLLAAWWVKPMFERAPLYVLSRQVFGQPVGWRAALRAWPAQLGGGWFRMLTWGRLPAAGRCLYQPVWVLEGARGKVARARRKVLGARNTGVTAIWFGIVSANLEGLLQIGLLAFLGIFLNQGQVINPFAYLVDGTFDHEWTSAVALTGMTLSGALMGPIYTACGFTLYLNRRASLEAWDIEIALRQVRAPVSTARRPLAAAACLLLCPMFLSLALLAPPPAQAGQPACAPPPSLSATQTPRGTAHDASQAALRAELDQLYASDDLRGYVCEDSWERKGAKETAKERGAAMPDLSLAALLLRWLLIGAAIAGAAWLLYRYRDRLTLARARDQARPATEIGGLDIRAETLPADVPATVRALWNSGQRRAALALLYRATLSHLVSQDGLALGSGATEGDCLRLAQQSRLDPRRLEVLDTASTLWLNGAYASRWPEDHALEAGCAAWQRAFGKAGQALAA